MGRRTNWLLPGSLGGQLRGGCCSSVAAAGGVTWTLGPGSLAPSLLPLGGKRGLRTPPTPAQAGPQWAKDPEALPGWPGNQQPGAPECKAGRVGSRPRGHSPCEEGVSGLRAQEAASPSAPPFAVTVPLAWCLPGVSAHSVLSLPAWSSTGGDTLRPPSCLWASALAAWCPAAEAP